jgi:hypothetical protein
MAFPGIKEVQGFPGTRQHAPVDATTGWQRESNNSLREEERALACCCHSDSFLPSFFLSFFLLQTKCPTPSLAFGNTQSLTTPKQEAVLPLSLSLSLSSLPHSLTTFVLPSFSFSQKSPWRHYKAGGLSRWRSCSSHSQEEEEEGEGRGRGRMGQYPRHHRHLLPPPLGQWDL